MSSVKVKRFYKDVAIAQMAEVFLIHLDGKTLQTPAQSELALPSLAIAEAIANEWQAQGTNILPETMPFTRLAFTAVDRVGPFRGAVIDQIAAYANSDVVCYRAEKPAELVERQAAAWDPIVAWAQEAHGITMETGAGIAFIAQSDATISAVTEIFANESDHFLVALHALTESAGSLQIALAVAANRCEAGEGFDRAHCDEIYQMEKWGADAEASKRFEARKSEFLLTADFLKRLR